MRTSFAVEEIAQFLDAEIRGSSVKSLKGINSLKDAKKGDLSFLANKNYSALLKETEASFVILSQADAGKYDGDCLVVKDPYLAYARISHWFAAARKTKRKMSGEPAIIPGSVQIGSNTCIGLNSVIGEDSIIGSNVSIGENVTIGEKAQIFPNVSIYNDVVIGKNAVIHSNSVIGSDGFGMARRDDGSWEKIAQLGSVSIGDNVEIGACCAIDRGALSDTEIHSGVKMDNHIQIAHNAIIGENTVMAAYCGIAGSSVIGKNCIFAGDVCVVGHVKVCDNVMVTARTLVTKSIKEPGSYSSGTTPLMNTQNWRKNTARFSQLDSMARSIVELKKSSKLIKD